MFLNIIKSFLFNRNTCIRFHIERTNVIYPKAQQFDAIHQKRVTVKIVVISMRIDLLLLLNLVIVDSQNAGCFASKEVELIVLIWNWIR